MPLRRLPNPPNPRWHKPVCHSPEHNPPGMIGLPPGSYEYICPACGSKKVFVVP